MRPKENPQALAGALGAVVEPVEHSFDNISAGSAQAGRRIIGVDVGLTGAVAIMSGASLTIFDMPTHVIKRGKAARRDIDLYELARLVDAAGPIDHAYIESVHSMPGQGVSSTFAFGKAFGTIIGIVAASFVPMTLVTPNEWKRQLRVPADKDGSRKRASELLPQYSELWNRAKDHGRAESALIALFGSRVQS